MTQQDDPAAESTNTVVGMQSQIYEMLTELRFEMSRSLEHLETRMDQSDSHADRLHAMLSSIQGTQLDLTKRQDEAIGKVNRVLDIVGNEPVANSNSAKHVAPSTQVTRQQRDARST